MRQSRIPLGWVILFLALAGSLAPAGRATATQPDANNEYWLSARDGAWLIYVTSYQGKEAFDLAHKFAHELRTAYKLKAFIYSRTAEDRAHRDRVLEETRRETGGAPVKKIRLPDECAVLIGSYNGGYKDMDDAKDDLNRIKKLKPPSADFMSSLVGAKTRFTPKEGQFTIGQREHEEAINPFQHAFAVPNPLVARERSAKTSVPEEDSDDLHVAEMNKREKYSLLRCPKPWTVIVKIYGGNSVVQPASKPSIFDRMRPWGNDGTSSLSKSGGRDLQAAAAEASKLAEMLRDPALGYEAYVLHTPDRSFVTVGGFPDRTDRRLMETIQQLAGLTVGSFKLEAKPMPMQVPRMPRPQGG